MNQNANVGMNAINAANATNEAISSPSPSNIEGKGGAATPVVVKPKKGDDVSIRYRGLTYEMAVELHLAEQQYFFWDLPVPFGEKLKLYPVNVRHYDDFMDAVSCLLLDKKQFSPNAKPEDIKKQLKMTDLEYLLSKMDNTEWMMKLITLVELVFHVKNGMKCPHCGEVMDFNDYKNAAQKLFQELVEKARLKEAEAAKSAEVVDEEVKEVEDSENENAAEEIQDSSPEKQEEEKTEGDSEAEETPTIRCPSCGGDGLYESIRYAENEQTHKMELFIDGQKIDFKDFTRLKNLVLFQNLPDYRDTSYIDPQLKKDYETQKRIKGQQRGNLSATLEQKLAALKVFEGLPSYESLYELSIRKFLIEFGKMDDLVTYFIQMMGRVCGFGSDSKTPVEHWIYQEIKDVYADGGYISKDTMMEKTKGIS